MYVLETPRLLLREWRDTDREPFAALNADPAVMEFFLSPLSRESSDASVEVGWRLARKHWGQGYATEAACAALEVGFARLDLREIVSFTTVGNLRSRAVMERIGMRDARQDFEYPGFPEGHPLRRHCLYRIASMEWAQSGFGPTTSQ